MELTTSFIEEKSTISGYAVGEHADANACKSIGQTEVQELAQKRFLIPQQR